MTNESRSGFLEGVGALTLVVVAAFVWWHVGGWIGNATGIDHAPVGVRLFGYGFFIGVAAR